MSKTSGLTVRQFERTGVEFTVEFIVADHHAPQVRFSNAASTLDQHSIRGKGVDISAGGCGFETPHYIPRQCEGTVRILDGKASGVSSDGTPVYDVVFEHKVRVRRVQMLAATPVYGVGVAFIDAAPGIDAMVSRLMARLAAAEPAGGVARA